MLAVDADRRLLRLRRTALIARLLALVAAATILIPLGSAGRLGEGLAVAPAVFALVVVVGVLIAELASRSDARRNHGAALEVRRIRDYLPRAITPAVAGCALVLAAVAGWTTRMAGPDDMGRSGRWLSYDCVNGACDQGSIGPWPGSFYTVPLGISLIVLVAVAAVTTHVAVRRPRNGADARVYAIDEQVRRQSVRTVLAAVLLALSGSLTGIGLFGAEGLVRNWDVLSSSLQAAGVLIAAATVIGFGLFIWSATTLLADLLDRSRSTEPVVEQPLSEAGR